uniref:Zic family member 4 n=1 Tax=Myotis myotis TaxID=51298 RepID=A0A7J8A3D0_MYOMY|nr:Zic family member 4 [Myotis myotis]
MRKRLRLYQTALKELSKLKSPLVC